jgi:hypothetical protein
MAKTTYCSNPALSDPAQTEQHPSFEAAGDRQQTLGLIRAYDLRSLRRRPWVAQAKLSRNSNQIARGRIRRFESYHPSYAVGGL